MIKVIIVYLCDYFNGLIFFNVLLLFLLLFFIIFYQIIGLGIFRQIFY
jgi:hypothetical protein